MSHFCHCLPAEPPILEFTTVSNVVLHRLQMHHIFTLLFKFPPAWLLFSHLACILMAGVKVTDFNFLMPLKSAQLKQLEAFLRLENTEAIIVQVVMEREPI